MRRAILAVGLCLIAVPAMAQSWRPIVKQCSAIVNQRLGCASCGSAWPLWVRCAAPRIYGNQIPPAKLDACIQGIWDRRWKQETPAMVGDPVAEVFACATGT